MLQQVSIIHLVLPSSPALSKLIGRVTYVKTLRWTVVAVGNTQMFEPSLKFNGRDFSLVRSWTSYSLVIKLSKACQCRSTTAIRLVSGALRWILVSEGRLYLLEIFRLHKYIKIASIYFVLLQVASRRNSVQYFRGTLGLSSGGYNWLDICRIQALCVCHDL